MLGNGLITLEKVKVIAYRAGAPDGAMTEGPGRHRVVGLLLLAGSPVILIVVAELFTEHAAGAGRRRRSEGPIR